MVFELKFKFVMHCSHFYCIHNEVFTKSTCGRKNVILLLVSRLCEIMNLIWSSKVRTWVVPCFRARLLVHGCRASPARAASPPATGAALVAPGPQRGAPGGGWSGPHHRHGRPPAQGTAASPARGRLKPLLGHVPCRGACEGGYSRRLPEALEGMRGPRARSVVPLVGEWSEPHHCHG